MREKEFIIVDVSDGEVVAVATDGEVIKLPLKHHKVPRHTKALDLIGGQVFIDTATIAQSTSQGL